MVYASAELAAAYTSAGAGAKHPPKDARAVAQQVAVLQARRAALILNDPLKDKVCRRSGWLAQRFAGGGACSTCHDQAKNPRSDFDCRVCHRHGPDKLDWAYEHFPAGCTVEFGKPEQRRTGVVRSYNPDDGRHEVFCDEEVVLVYLSFGKNFAEVTGARPGLCEQRRCANTSRKPAQRHLPPPPWLRPHPQPHPWPKRWSSRWRSRPPAVGVRARAAGASGVKTRLVV